MQIMKIIKQKTVNIRVHLYTRTSSCTDHGWSKQNILSLSSELSTFESLSSWNAEAAGRPASLDRRCCAAKSASALRSTVANFVCHFSDFRNWYGRWWRRTSWSFCVWYANVTYWPVQVTFFHKMKQILSIFCAFQMEYSCYIYFQGWPKASSNVQSTWTDGFSDEYSRSAIFSNIPMQVFKLPKNGCSWGTDLLPGRDFVATPVQHYRYIVINNIATGKTSQDITSWLL